MQGMSNMAPQGPLPSPHPHPHPPSSSHHHHHHHHALMSSSSHPQQQQQQQQHHTHQPHQPHPHILQTPPPPPQPDVAPATTPAGLSGLSLGLRFTSPSSVTPRPTQHTPQSQQQQHHALLNSTAEHHLHQQQNPPPPLPLPVAPTQAIPPSPPVPRPLRIKLGDILPDDGAPTPTYCRAVEALSNSLTRHNAAVIELGQEDAALIRCALESSKLFFKHRFPANSGPVPGAPWPGKARPGVYLYRAGRPVEEEDSSPPCMTDVFRCLGKVSRAAISAIARNLRLRSDVFNRLLDDLPLPANEVSSSVLVATYSPPGAQNIKNLLGVSKSTLSGESEKGLLTLIASDSPGIQVCDPNGRWYLADNAFGPGDILLLIGRALGHATAGLRPAASYRVNPELSPVSGISGRVSLSFKLMPQSNAILDCSAISEAGHVIPQSYGRISVSQFMDELSTEESGLTTSAATMLDPKSQITEPSLRMVLSDPSTGSYLEDAVVARCGHSFGGATLRKVYETSRCVSCGADVEVSSMVPNVALRAAATAVKFEDDRKQFHNAAMRKRRKEAEQGDRMKRDDIGFFMDRDGSRQSKGVQYPFAVNEKVKIKGNKRTPDKFVGKEAIITSQCLNGWYLLKSLDTGESVRLQYRSLEKLISQHNGLSEDRHHSQQMLTNAG